MALNEGKSREDWSEIWALTTKDRDQVIHSCLGGYFPTDLSSKVSLFFIPLILIHLILISVSYHCLWPHTTFCYLLHLHLLLHRYLHLSSLVFVYIQVSFHFIFLLFLVYGLTFIYLITIFKNWYNYFIALPCSF